MMPSHRTLRTLTVAAILACAGRAWAQLDLEGSPPPAPGSGVSALALVEVLSKEVADISGSVSVSPRDQARAALRRIARDLIRSGEQAGPQGSVRILVGRSIAMRLPALEATLDTPGVDGVTLLALARDLSVADDKLPTADGAIDGLLRDAFGVIAIGQEGWADKGGWFDPAPRSLPAGDSANLDAIARKGRVAGPTAEHFAALESRLAAGEHMSTMRATVMRARGDLARAGQIAFGAKPDWLSDEAILEVRRRYSEAVKQLSTGGGAMDQVQRLATLADIADGLAKLDSGKNAKAARAAIAELVVSPAWEADPDLPGRLRAIVRTLALAAPTPTDDKALVRQLRPLLRAIEPTNRNSGNELLEIVPRLAKQADALSDPAVLGALSVHERHAADLALVRRLNEFFAGEKSPSGEPAINPSYKGMADRVLGFAQDLGRADTRDAALEEIRDFAAQLDDYRALGDPALRQVLDSPRAVAIAQRAKELGPATDAARQAWQTERSSPRGTITPEKGRRLSQLRAGAEMIRDAVWAIEFSGASEASSLEAWPGWEMTPGAAKALVKALPAQTGLLVDRLLTGSEEEIEKFSKQLISTHGAALLAGRLERLLKDAGVARATTPGADALAQIALGPPSDSAILAEFRGELAGICRYGEECALAIEQKNQAGGEAIRGYINTRAAIVLAALGPKR